MKEYMVPFEEMESLEFELTMANVELKEGNIKEAKKRIKQALKELITIYHTREMITCPERIYREIHSKTEKPSPIPANPKKKGMKNKSKQGIRMDGSSI